MGGFPSGQRGQTVNLLAVPSEVRILLPPFVKTCVNSIAQMADTSLVSLFSPIEKSAVRILYVQWWISRMIKMYRKMN